MKFTSIVKVQGMKRSKGSMEGVAYDSTKFYIETDMDDSKNNSLGTSTTEYVFGTSDEYERYMHLPFPFTAEGSFNQVTTGKVTKLMLVALKPLTASPQAKSA
ncbi:MAG: hypothetical protein ACD_10C00303G0001 [uncultured bacterium]|nr:MAG: hypothetical protein ACD_10C00303G0001 [uncultured bacterium]